MSASSVFEQLENNDKELRVLDFERYSYAFDQDPKLMKRLANALKKNTVLGRLDFTNQYIGIGDGTVLADGLAENNSLQILNLKLHHGFNSFDAVAMANALKKNTKLWKLSLINCEIKDEGAVALANALKTDNTTVSNLIIPYNKIGDEGAMAFADTLRQNTNLQELDMAGNHLTCAGAATILEALKHNTNLRTLRLRGCEIDSSIMELLLDIVKTTKLKTLDLSTNRLDSASVKLLEEAKQENLNLDLTWNQSLEERKAEWDY